MSPTENDLRAALHHGEGDGPNVERIIAGAQTARARRRQQLLTTAGVCVLVAGLGVGGVFIARGGGGSDTTSNNAGGAGSYAQSDQRGAAGGYDATAPSAAPAASAAAVPCPSSLPRYLLPGTTRPGQPGADGPLFAAPVTATVVCAYGAENQALGTTPPSPARTVLTGAKARLLADSLEQAPTTKPSGMCPMIRRADEQAVAVIGLDASGKPVGTVTTTLHRVACAVVVTNGTAVRYAWSPPAELEGDLASLNPQAGRSHGPVVNGSPTK